MLGALITAVYSFRLVFVVFFGEQRTAVGFRPGMMMTLPLIILAGLSLVVGYVELPHVLGNVHYFSELMSTALPVTEHTGLTTETEVTFLVFPMVISLLGILIAYVAFLQRPFLAAALASSSVGGALSRFWFEGWGFDRLYDALVVRPFLWSARVNKDDFIDQMYQGLARLCRQLYGALHETQTGQVRWYAAVLATGSVAIVALVMFS
jgi:NADH-quinone oxidoreductase subunit L